MNNKSKGRNFEGFSIGDIFQSGSRKISETDLFEFAQLTGDKNRIHMDPVFAAKSIYGGRVAHGLLGLAVVSGLAVETGFARDTAVAFRNLTWKFIKPVKIGDEIRAVFTVIGKKDLSEKPFGLVKFSVEVRNQFDQQVHKGTWSILIIKGYP